MWKYKRELIEFTNVDWKDINDIMNDFSKSGWEIFSINESTSEHTIDKGTHFDGIIKWRYVLFMKKLAE